MASEELVQSVADANTKTEAGMPAWALARKMSNDISHDKVIDSIRETQLEAYTACMSDLMRRVSSLDTLEAGAVGDVRLSALAERMTALGDAIAALQIGIKGAGNTPPVTP